MTKQEREIAMYGMTEHAIRYKYMTSTTAKLSGLGMVVAGILSDTQEMLAMDAGPRAAEYVRQQMNVAKFVLFEMMDEKRKESV